MLRATLLAAGALYAAASAASDIAEYLQR